MAEFLATDSSLRAIGLHYNGFGPQGAAALAAALHTNHTLQELAIYSNNIGPDGAEVVATALAVNRGVVSVDMGGNAIGDAGARAIARALRQNTTVTDLHLDFNQIGEDGANALAAALSDSHPDSGDLSVSSQNYGEDNITVNTTLTTLWLHGNAVRSTVQRSIDLALDRNLKLVPRRLAAAYQRLALAALFTHTLRGPAADAFENKLATSVRACTNEQAALICQAGGTIATPLVSSRFEREGWAWRTTQDLTADVCTAVLKVAAGRDAAGIRALLGTVVSALSAGLNELAEQKEMQLDDASSSYTALEGTTATRRKQRETATQDTSCREGIGTEHKKKKQKQKQLKNSNKERAESGEKCSSLADLIATASLAAYQTQCPVRIAQSAVVAYPSPASEVQLTT